MNEYLSLVNFILSEGMLEWGHVDISGDRIR